MSAASRHAPAFEEEDTPQGRFVCVTRHPRSGREIEAFGGAKRFRGKSVIDVGTGDGRLAFDVARYARRVLGVDPHADAIALAWKRCHSERRMNLEFRVADARTLEIGRARFDRAILSWSL